MFLSGWGRAFLALIFGAELSIGLVGGDPMLAVHMGLYDLYTACFHWAGAYSEAAVWWPRGDCAADAPTQLDLAWFWLQCTGVATYTIWARGVGPRFRPDQLSDLVWRDLLLFLAALLLCAAAALLW